ncbi:Predicted nucleic acid-binding protein, contains PIN domain [Halorientalis persicus]|uniref:Ribonuclease VapC n=1 Tax=Halorientalis persicus TaxID=1367881 RepID=A0A1H8MSH4_9EURY|nr:type II toxin-antitoxin system VapC family toxin [Halorientalis persicus]SEO20372.1 Predicted nucleic acid-binding protein, contains PIN domain [Halorientalis persicus]
MADIVVDTSTVVKWYIPEQHHEQARTLRDDFLNGKHDLCAPALMPFEAVNALNYSGHYDGERLREAAHSLDNYGIELVAFGSVGPIAEITNAVDITAYDAAYVALAVERDEIAYTADGNLLQDLDGSEYEDTVAHIQTY